MKIIVFVQKNMKFIMTKDEKHNYVYEEKCEKIYKCKMKMKMKTKL